MTRQTSLKCLNRGKLRVASWPVAALMTIAMVQMAMPNRWSEYYAFQPMASNRGSVIAMASCT